MATGLRCYFPNGSISPSVPCDPSANATHCCLKKEQCLTNGICAIDATINYGVQFARGTCSDPTWESPVCPKVCRLNQDTATNSSAHDFRANGAGIYECNGVGYAKEAEFCCESASEKTRCCSTTTAIFTMPAATLGPVAIYANITSSSSIISTTVSTPSATLASSTPPSATSSTATGSSTEGISRSSTIGAAVGGTIGACLLIAALVFLILRRRKHQRTAATELDSPPTEKPATLGAEHYRHEVDAGVQRHELAVPQAELPTKDVFVELPAKHQ